MKDIVFKYKSPIGREEIKDKAYLPKIIFNLSIFTVKEFHILSVFLSKLQGDGIIKLNDFSKYISTFKGLSKRDCKIDNIIYCLDKLEKYGYREWEQIDE